MMIILNLLPTFNHKFSCCDPHFNFNGPFSIGMTRSTHFISVFNSEGGNTQIYWMVIFGQISSQ